MDRADLIEAVKKRTATVSEEDLGFLFDVIAVWKSTSVLGAPDNSSLRNAP